MQFFLMASSERDELMSGIDTAMRVTRLPKTASFVLIHALLSDDDPLCCLRKLPCLALVVEPTPPRVTASYLDPRSGDFPARFTFCSRLFYSRDLPFVSVGLRRTGAFGTAAAVSDLPDHLARRPSRPSTLGRLNNFFQLPALPPGTEPMRAAFRSSRRARSTARVAKMG